jgi:hypothetical protein
MTPTIRKIVLRARDGSQRPYWEVDLRYRKRGTRRRFSTQAAAKAYADQVGQTAKRGRPVMVKPPSVEQAVTDVLTGRRGSCAPATYTILAQQLGRNPHFWLRPQPTPTARWPQMSPRFVTISAWSPARTISDSHDERRRGLAERG